MKLSDLVTYKLKQNFNAGNDLKTYLHEYKRSLIRTLGEAPEELRPQIKNQIDGIVSVLDHAADSMLHMQLELNEIQTELEKASEPYIAECHAKSYELYDNDHHSEDEFYYDSIGIKKPVPDEQRVKSAQERASYDLFRYRNSNIHRSKDVIEMLDSRTGLYSTWQQPGIHIRPGTGELTGKLKALDPLYLLDEEELIFHNIKQMFTPEYQARLRYGHIKDSDKEIFHLYPKESFGFILITEYFNYKPFDIIKKYLNEIYGLLKPGGAVLFTYNNCDQIYGVQNAEKQIAVYTPKTLVQELVRSIGFEIITHYDYQNISWFEIKKPGTLTTLRGGQCLAKIIRNEDDVI